MIVLHTIESQHSTRSLLWLFSSSLMAKFNVLNLLRLEYPDLTEHPVGVRDSGVVDAMLA